MLPAPISQLPRNLFQFGVSIVVALVAMFATAAADRIANDSPPRHDTTFREVPGGKLSVRAVVYDGATNGSLVVQVKNSSKSAQKFSASGLYFIPEGNPDTAPQRLGAVGPMQIMAEATHKEVRELEIAAGATVEVTLDVFCIDSHRSSPSPQNRFNVAATPMPSDLAATIERRAESAVAASRAGGAAAPRPAAKGNIQSEVWKSRDAKWIELDGEGKQESAKRRK